MLRQRGLLILGVTLIVGAAALGLSFALRGQPVYRAEAVVAIERTVDTNLLAEKMRTLLGKNDPAATASRMAGFLTVTRAAKAVGLLDPRLSDADVRFNPAYSEVVETLRERIHTWADDKGRIHIVVLDPEPKSAYFLANLLVRAYAGIRTEELVSGTTVMAKLVNDQLRLEERLLEETEARLRRLEAGPDFPLRASQEAALKAKIGEHRKDLDQLQTTRRQIAYLTSGRLEQLRILEAASLPRRPEGGPRTALNTLLGLLAGLLASTGLALVLQQRDRGTGLALAVEDLLRLPVLGFVPWQPDLEEDEEDEDQASGEEEEKTRSPLERLVLDEGLRQSGQELADRLSGLPAGSSAKAIGLIGTEPGSGATVLSLHVALALTGAGKKVLLVDAHPGPDGLTALLELEGGPGLAEVLAGEREGQEAILDRDELPAWPDQVRDGLFFLPAGTRIPGASDPSNQAWSRLLALARLGYDAVVVDLPGPRETGKAGLGRHLDRLLLVQWLDGMPLEKLQEAVENLEPDGARLAAVIFNGYDGATLPDLDPFRGVDWTDPDAGVRAAAGRPNRRAVLALVLVAAALLAGGLYLYQGELGSIQEWLNKLAPVPPSAPTVREPAPTPTTTTTSPTAAPVKTPVPVPSEKPEAAPEEKETPAPAVEVQTLRDTETEAPSLAYTLKVASFRSREDALKLAQSLSRPERGAYVTWVRLPGKGEWFRVFLGAFASAAEARGALQQTAPDLKEQGFAPETAQMPFALALKPDRTLTPEDIQRLADGGLTPYRLAPGRPVLVGAFYTRSGAEALAERLGRDGFQTDLVSR